MSPTCGANWRHAILILKLVVYINLAQLHLFSVSRIRTETSSISTQDKMQETSQPRNLTISPAELDGYAVMAVEAVSSETTWKIVSLSRTWGKLEKQSGNGNQDVGNFWHFVAMPQIIAAPP